MATITLASASSSRITLLRNAGIDFTVRPAGIDERAVEAPLAAAGKSPAAIALALAEAKALALGDESADSLVIGADQVLAAEGRRWHKPSSMREARAQIVDLSGRTHELHSAVALSRGGRIAWTHHSTARMTMRPLGADVIDAYLARVGETATASVGAYQIEGPGIQLFERIEGDYFTILGLPLLPLLARLREEGAIK
jgi:septum formation protein